MKLFVVVSLLSFEFCVGVTGSKPEGGECPAERTCVCGSTGVGSL